MAIVRRLAWLFALLAALAADPLRAVSPGELAGRWRDAGGGPVAEFRLQPEGGDRFLVTVRFTDGGRWDLECVPTGRPGVWAASSPTGMLDWLFARRRGEPLEGAPLFWARAAAGGVTLVLYRLAIAPDGGFRLDRLALTPAAEGLDYDLRILAHDRETVRLAGRLVR